MVVDKLKQYLCRSSLAISSVKLPLNKATKSAEKTAEKVCRITGTNLDIAEKTDYELGKEHRIPLIKSHQTKKNNTQNSEYHK